MRWSYLFATLLGTLLFSSCGLNHSGSTAGVNPGKHPSGTGPFDRNGNYVEAWADTPSKWSKKPSSPSHPVFTSPQPPTEIAANSTAEGDPPAIPAADQPPANATPLPAGPTVVGAKPEVESRPLADAHPKKLSNTTKKPTKTASNDTLARTVRKTSIKPAQKETLAKAGGKTRKPAVAAASTSSKTKVAVKGGGKSTPSKTSKSELASKSKATKGKTPPKVASAPSTPKAKTKTSTVRYKVKKGESLAAIAKRNKTTVTAIQKANGIKGGTVAAGKTIVVPKY